MSGASLRLSEYLEQQPGTFFNRLYQQPSTALAIFRRMLPHLAKTLVMSILFLYHPLPASDLESWIRPDCRGERDKALSILDRLKILRTVSTKGGQAYVLGKQFAASLRQALTGGGSHKSFGIPCNSLEKDRVSIDQLDEFARKQWEGLLSFMVGSASGGSTHSASQISDGVKRLLEEGGLVKSHGRRTAITQDGFSFVLEEVNAQVWTILVFYLDAAPTIRMDPGDVLSFFFQLGSLELGQDYSKANLSATQVQMLEDLNDFGLVYQSSSKSKRFYPTRLATTLTSDASALRNSSVGLKNSLRSSDGQGQGFIVIETNYRIYAYTTSDLQIAILSLFCRLNSRLPNLVTGKISRQSIREAVSMGITADQIISFLNTHAHSNMRKNNPVLPASVVDQIRLWQIEGERMKSTNGYLFKDFSSAAEHEEVCRYARDLGVLIWRNDQRRMCFVTEVQQIATFMKSKGKRHEKSASAEKQA